MKMIKFSRYVVLGAALHVVTVATMQNCQLSIMEYILRKRLLLIRLVSR